MWWKGRGTKPPKADKKLGTGANWEGKEFVLDNKQARVEQEEKPAENI